jgi:hypothetical protein
VHPLCPLAKAEDQVVIMCFHVFVRNIPRRTRRQRCRQCRPSGLPGKTLQCRRGTAVASQEQVRAGGVPMSLWLRRLGWRGLWLVAAYGLRLLSAVPASRTGGSGGAP